MREARIRNAKSLQNIVLLLLANYFFLGICDQEDYLNKEATDNIYDSFEGSYSITHAYQELLISEDSAVYPTNSVKNPFPPIKNDQEQSSRYRILFGRWICSSYKSNVANSISNQDVCNQLGFPQYLAFFSKFYIIDENELPCYDPNQRVFLYFDATKAKISVDSINQVLRINSLSSSSSFYVKAVMFSETYGILESLGNFTLTPKSGPCSSLLVPNTSGLGLIKTLNACGATLVPQTTTNNKYCASGNSQKLLTMFYWSDGKSNSACSYYRDTTTTTQFNIVEKDTTIGSFEFYWNQGGNTYPNGIYTQNITWRSSASEELMAFKFIVEVVTQGDHCTYSEPIQSEEPSSSSSSTTPSPTTTPSPIQFTINENNSPPYFIRALQTITVKVGQLLSYSLPEAADKENDKITTKVFNQNGGTTLPSFVNYASAQKIFYLNPILKTQVGTINIIIELQDDAPKPLKQSYTLVIQIESPNQVSTPIDQPDQVQNQTSNDTVLENSASFDDVEDPDDGQTSSNPTQQVKEPPTAKISSIDNQGNVIVMFSEKLRELKGNQNQTSISRIIDGQVLKVVVVLNQGQTQSDLSYTWSTTSLSQSQMAIKLNFEKPLSVSFPVRLCLIQFITSDLENKLFEDSVQKLILLHKLGYIFEPKIEFCYKQIYTQTAQY